MIGYDDIQGVQRFIFADALTGGINIIAALIGLFAIPQVLEMLSRGRTLADIDVITVRQQSLTASFREMMSNMKALSIGTITGSIIGIIPGVGGQIAGQIGRASCRGRVSSPV